MPLDELATRDRDSIDRVRALVDCEFSYARRDGDAADYVIELSSLPWRQGSSLGLQWIRELDLSSEVVIDPHSASRWQVVTMADQEGDDERYSG